jgi:molybdenum cofactor synthesis domain-containing protein
MTETVTVEIFIIGNEILNGEIQDTNTCWLCREVHRLGGRVVRATVLGDDLGVVAAELKAALKRGSRVIFTAGGLGPTADDLPLAAVARGAGVKLLPHDGARKMVKASYDALHARGILEVGGLIPAREKMARLPQGAVPLANPVGTAPGVLLSAGETTIISFPGVPPELQGIFRRSLQPFLQATFRSGLSVQHILSVDCNDESLFEPVLSRVAASHPGVYIKSLATPPGEMAALEVFLSAAGTGRAELEQRIGAALRDLKAGLDVLGFGYRERPLADAGRKEPPDQP